MRDGVGRLRRIKPSNHQTKIYPVRVTLRSLLPSICTVKPWDERYFAGKASDGVMIL